MSAELPGLGDPQGLSWSWEMDFAALLAVIGDATSPDASIDNEEAAREADAAERDGASIAAGVLAARVAERLPPGPDLTAWLATAPADDLTDHDLAGAASAWRRVVSWAQSQELAVVAQFASRAAARDQADALTSTSLARGA